MRGDYPMLGQVQRFYFTWVPPSEREPEGVPEIEPSNGAGPTLAPAARG
jgi:hypothetical protein